jgi:hypothetical protein
MAGMLSGFWKTRGENQFCVMKKSIAIALLIFISCEGKLTDEQRKKMREGMERHSIKKVSDAEITEAAYKEGRRLIAMVESSRNDSSGIDSVVRSQEGRMRFIVPGKGNATALEQQLVEAYLANPDNTSIDNVQKLRHGNIESDSILYTKPVLVKMKDGSEQLEGVWNIWISKKKLILAMDK